MTMFDDGVDEQTALLELLYRCPTAIVQFDSAGTIQLMNPVGVQILMAFSGGSIENMFDVFEEAAPEVREMVSRYPDRVGRICDEHRVIVNIPGASGTRSLILSLTMQKVDDDVLVAVIGDVTAAALRETIVRTNEARLHAVFEGVNDYGICTLDINGVITSWNQAAERMEGFRADEVIGVTADLLLPTRGSGREPIAPLLELARNQGRHEFETWRIRKDGSRFWANSIISTLRDKSDALIGYSIVTRDMTKHKRSEDQLRLQASTDPLTGAYNRRAFYDAAVQAEMRWGETKALSSVLMLDLDNFKGVNDRFGHDAGDNILRHFVGIVHGELRNVDIIGRHGGEEFLVLLSDTDGATAMRVAERIRVKLAATPLAYEKQTISITVSIGVAQLGAASNDMASLIRAADAALYVAKSSGRNTVRYAEPAASAPTLLI